MKVLPVFLALVTMAFIIILLTDIFLLRPRWHLSGPQCPPDESVLNESLYKLMSSTDPGELCPFPSPFLEFPTVLNTSNITISEVNDLLPFVQPGGADWPTLCKSPSRVAILVAFRDREQHLGIFLRHLHPFLKRLLLDYRIFIIQMTENGYFNKGALFNAGFKELQKRFKDHFRCVVLQDVDVLPETDCISYLCKDQAWHLASNVDRFDYTLLYSTIIGGSFQISMDAYRRANGFSNQFVGWGGEDDDFERRLRAYGIGYGRFPSWSKWTTLRHEPGPVFQNRTRILFQLWIKRLKIDGLKTVEYELVDYVEEKLYTNITVRILNKSLIRGNFSAVNMENTTLYLDKDYKIIDT